MDNDWEPYTIGRAGKMEDTRQHTGNDLSANREEMLNDMLDIILKHKKEITKVPQCSTHRGALEWVAKRPNSGFKVSLADIGGDPENEVVVYDRAGRPFMVNGYRLKPSDYGLRKAYWEANPTSEQRAGNPMREWVRDNVWGVQEDADNKWNRSIIRNHEMYDKMKAWGYRMPTKPKAKIAPYAIFSKLIAPMVKQLFESQELYDRMRDTSGSGTITSPTNKEFLKKIISPISMYRYLFMRLIEQKYYWSLQHSEATQRIVTSYGAFENWMKKRKDHFRAWFIENVLAGKNKDQFKTGWVNQQAILDALVKDDCNWAGEDIQDGIVFMVGVKNIQDDKAVPITVDENQQVGTAVFSDFLVNGDLAHEFLRNLNNKKEAPFYRQCKAALDRYKKVAGKSMEAYLKDGTIKKKFFDDEKARQIFYTSIGQGLANATGAASFERQTQVASPVKPPVVTVTPAEAENGTPTGLTATKIPTADDNFGLELIAEPNEEEDAEVTIPPPVSPDRRPRSPNRRQPTQLTLDGFFGK